MCRPATGPEANPGRRSIPLYPPLLAAFPVVSLYSANVALVPPSQLWEPLTVVVVVVCVLWALCGLVLRDAHRGAAIAATVAMAILMYGHVAERFSRVYDAPLVAGWCVATLLVVLGVTTAPLAIRRAAPVLNVVGVAAMLVTSGSAMLRVLESVWHTPRHFAEAARAGSESPERPDIYYIILDGYGRADQLQRVMGFDDRPFVDALRQRGFYVADQSHSNYVQTELSISSSLNENYLTAVIPNLDRAGSDRGILDRLVDDNAVARRLKARGYDYVAVTTGFPSFQFPSADQRVDDHGRFSLLEAALINETPLGRGTAVGATFYEQRRAQLSGAFRSLNSLAPRTLVPRFVFAHILAPHPPFVFGPNGEARQPREMQFSLSDGSHFMESGGTPAEYRWGYREQVSWVNSQVLAFLDTLLSQPGPKPIVLIQGDHGSKLRLDQNSLAKTDIDECMANLAAFYVPNSVMDRLYPSITPVNSFRLVLGEVCRERLNLLPDRSYYSTWGRPFDFVDVTNLLNRPHSRRIETP